MSYGVAAYGTDGKLTFHSDYSSIIYYGALSTTTTAVRPVYTGDYHMAISSSVKDSNYDMGWLIQYSITLNVDYMIPFYCPAFNNQEIAIIDIVNESTTWIVNVLYSGSQTQYPSLYAFCPISEIGSSIPLNSHGIAVYDANSQLVFTDSRRPLRIDDVVTITHPSSIKTGARGTCGYQGTANGGGTCHINYTADQLTSTSGTLNNTSSKLYHIVPSAYGGLAYNNTGTGSRSCSFLGLGTRNFSWAYKSWASFRGVLRHPQNQATHIATWKGDFAGSAYQYAEGGCGIGGFLGALIGGFLALFTFGAALTLIGLIGGALAGFAVGGMTVGSTPSLVAYDNDAVFDQSGRSQNLMVTDKSYYGIS